MKKNGFTLIELLGVIIILALLVILVFPSIINSVRSSSEKTDDLTLQLIYNAADLYMDDNVEQFNKENGNKYIITLQDLVDEGLLVAPIKLSESDDDLTNKKCVQVSYDNGFDYELKNNGECEIWLYGNKNVDINGDNILNDDDVILLSKYLFSFYGLEFDKSLIKGDTDLDSDGKISLTDVNMLSETHGFVTTVPGILGDANGDGLITNEDAELIKRYVASSITSDNIILENSDVDGDENFTTNDALAIEFAITGIVLSTE